MATSEKAKKRDKDRHRNWALVVYPESAPQDWREQLDALNVPWVESPLHDSDVDASGEVKKAHWHVLLLFDGVKHFEQVKAITGAINAPIPQVVNSATGVVRYMAHIDNPEKYQYSPSDIVSHNGADVAKFLRPTSAGRYQAIREMYQWVVDNEITEFKQLALYAATERYDDWHVLLCDNSAHIMGEFIKSCRHEKKSASSSRWSR